MHLDQGLIKDPETDYRSGAARDAPGWRFVPRILLFIPPLPRYTLFQENIHSMKTDGTRKDTTVHSGPRSMRAEITKDTRFSLSIGGTELHASDGIYWNIYQWNSIIGRSDQEYHHICRREVVLRWQLHCMSFSNLIGLVSPCWKVLKVIQCRYLSEWINWLMCGIMMLLKSLLFCTYREVPPAGWTS